MREKGRAICQTHLDASRHQRLGPGLGESSRRHSKKGFPPLRVLLGGPGAPPCWLAGGPRGTAIISARFIRGCLDLSGCKGLLPVPSEAGILVLTYGFFLLRGALGSRGGTVGVGLGSP